VNAASGQSALASLRNVGRAALADFERLGIVTVAQLATKDADTLYVQLCEATGQIHDPCVHDVFTATIHQAKTGAPVNWWAYTPARKLRQASGTFPKVALRHS